MSRVFVAAMIAVSAVVASAGAAVSQPTWSIRTSTNPPGARIAMLSALSCTKLVCFAVGQATTSAGRSAPLIERPGPAGWTIVASPKPQGARFSELSGVSCPAVNVCFAVGSADNKTLIERWNGATWSIMPSPDKPRWGGQLSAVTCLNIKNCFAVGEYQAALIATFVVHWNGSKWSILPSPSRKPSPQFSTPGVNDLVGVSCTSAVNCFAVGGDSDYQFSFKETLIEHWNGRKWSIVPSPKGPYKYNELAAVSCPRSNSCYAVGDSATDAGANPTARSLLVHWDGAKWTRDVSADSGARRDALTGVSCVGPGSCVAVGASADGATLSSSTLIESLSANTWSVVPSPAPPSGTYAALGAVGCVTATSCNAVGTFGDLSAFGPLVEHSD